MLCDHDYKTLQSFNIWLLTFILKKVNCSKVEIVLQQNRLSALSRRSLFNHLQKCLSCWVLLSLIKVYVVFLLISFKPKFFCFSKLFLSNFYIPVAFLHLSTNVHQSITFLSWMIRARRVTPFFSLEVFLVWESTKVRVCHLFLKPWSSFQ